MLENFLSLSPGRRARPKVYPALTADEAYQGILHSLDNARDLLVDARILLEGNRWPRAVSLSVLALEEVGKANVIRLILIAGPDSQLRKLWGHYYRHISKSLLTLYSIIQFMHSGTDPSASLNACIEFGLDFSDGLDELKQDGFYSDYVDPGLWQSPSEWWKKMRPRPFFVRQKHRSTRDRWQYRHPN